MRPSPDRPKPNLLCRKSHLVWSFAAAIAAGGLLACGSSESTGELAAIAKIEPTRDHEASGTVRFDALDSGGVRVVATLEGLEAGQHAFHVHEVGDCTENAAAAGPHFDFLDGADREKPGPMPERITGNLGELHAEPDGVVRLEATIGTARLDGPRSILGRAVVVHARGNDPSQPPDGDAGARIACGVIEPANDRFAANP